MASKELRLRTEQAKNELRETGRAVWRSPVLVRCAEWLIRLLLAAVLAGGEVLGGVSPFGLALVGASGAGSGGFAAMLGAVLGYLLSRGLEEGLRYAAGCVLVFSVSFAFFDLKVYQKGWFMPLAAAALNGLTGLVTLTARPVTPTLAAQAVGEFALTLLGVYAFRSAFALWNREESCREAGTRQRLGLILLGLATLISLAGLELLGRVSVGRLLACAVSLCAASAAGPGAGAAVGLASGLAMDLTTGLGRFYAVSYPFAALTAGLLRRQGRFLSALGFVLSSGLVLLWSWDSGAPMSAVYEVLAAAALFLVIPQRLLAQAGLLFSVDAPAGAGQWAAQAAARRLRDTASAFSEVFSALRTAFDRSGDQGEDPSVIYDRAANRVCVSCPLRDRCWQTGYQETFDLLNNALPHLLADRQAKAEHFPARFRDRCVRFSSFLTAVGEELSAHLLRRRYASQVGRSRRAVCDQYGDMARMLEETAAAMAAPLSTDQARTRRLRQFLASRELNCQGLVFYDEQNHLQIQLEGGDAKALADEAGRQALSSVLELPLAPALRTDGRVLYRQREPLSVLAGVSGRKRQGQSVSGDACAWFKDDRGRLYILLCDGMGSGPEARRESDLALHLLEKFLRAGVTPINALKTLDQALALREEAAGGFSTVDLLELDLYSGKGCLYKLGAAPSFLKRGGSIRRLSGVALPAGLQAADLSAPDQTELQLDPGDCLVLLTDGVLDGDDDEWLRSALAAFDGGSPAALADQLIAHEPQSQDDKTALVLRVGLRAQQSEQADRAAI